MSAILEQVVVYLIFLSFPPTCISMTTPVAVALNGREKRQCVVAAGERFGTNHVQSECLSRVRFSQ